MKPKYNPLPLLLYAWGTTPDIPVNYDKTSYISRRLLELGYCTNCDNTGRVEVMKACTKPMSSCCGGCTEEVDCEACQKKNLEGI